MFFEQIEELRNIHIKVDSFFELPFPYSICHLAYGKQDMA